MRKRFVISNAAGFTLVELLVVMVIIGLLATLVAPGLFKQFGKGQHEAAKAQLASIEQGLDKFRLDIGRYPTSQEGLNSLVNSPGIEKWDGPYIKSSLLLDPWKKPYQYQSPGSHGEYDLFSYGRDGSPGGDGQDKDITSWE
ncbi:MAG TPA: type II secretion system major pseudopilin GspG [Thermodesulfovibrionales bacterium]|nr:type II secretion system major pseudopilin GspG [Thermodesulfovibrionales bacterium]